MTSQFLYMLTLLAVGLVMVMVFDVYNTVTSASRWLRWLRPSLDITFWVASAGFVYGAVFYLDSGRLRLYTFALIAVGYVAYRLTFHHQVVGSAFAILRLIEAFIRGVYRLVYILTIRPLLVLWRITLALATFLYRALCMVEDWVFWGLGFWCRVMLLPRLLKLPWIQRGWTRICRRWEDICAQASKWLKTKEERV